MGIQGLLPLLKSITTHNVHVGKCAAAVSHADLCDISVILILGVAATINLLMTLVHV